MASGRITGTSDNGRYLYIDWSHSGSTFTASLYLVGDLTGIANSGSHFTVAGDRYNITGNFDNWGTGKPLHLKTFTKTISGGSVAMSGAFIYNGGSWTAAYVSGTATLTTIPPAPTNAKISGFFDKGATTTFSWNVVLEATSYEIWYRFWYKRTNTYTDWKLKHTTTASLWNVTHAEATPDAMQLGVKAKNSAGVSSMTTSGWQYRQGVRVNSGGFKRGYIKVWNGSSWVQGYIYVWNGSSWVEGQ